MRIIFMGTTEFSRVILQSLIEEGYDIVSVVTQPDRPFGRKKKLKAPIVKDFALDHGLHVFQSENINRELSYFKSLNADLIVTCAFGQIVSKDILEIPKRGAVNVHASLLPKYRGGAPIHWSIIQGDKQTGLTLMEMDEGMDSGAIITKRSVDIEPNDTMGSVEEKLKLLSVSLIKKDLKSYLNGEVQAQAQDESQVSYAYVIKPKDEYIDFNRDVETVYNHMRGLIPWPVSHAFLDGQRIKFHQVRKVLEPGLQKKPGTVLKVSAQSIDIACTNGYISVLKIQPFGKGKMSAQDFYNGYQRTWEGKVFNE